MIKFMDQGPIWYLQFIVVAQYLDQEAVVCLMQALIALWIHASW